MHPFNLSVFWLLLMSMAALAYAAEPDPATQPAPPADPGAPASAVEHWRSLRYGMFIHWGPVSLTGREISWSRGGATPIEEYDNLYTKFNPKEFDADQWVSIAKSAGMKYIVLTTKHHDGFCLWPTKFNQYNIAKTPFQRDVVGELAKACKKQGIEFGTYYSVCDWHHPDFPNDSPGGREKKPNPDLPRYLEYLRNQTTELVQNYGPLLTIWFDVPQEVHAPQGLPTLAMLRKLQPNILINNRAYRGFPGDYITPEQKVGGFNREKPWESCMTISAHNHWAWGGENDGVKSLQKCVEMLIQCNGGDGNLLLNVGPRPDGRIDPQQAARLKEIGDWIAPRKEAIHNTRGGPYKPGKWGASTCKDHRVFLFVMKWPEQGPLTLPKFDAKITGVKLLAGAGKVQLSSSDQEITLDVPADERDQIATVIELTIDGPALEINRISTTPTATAPTTTTAPASQPAAAATGKEPGAPSPPKEPAPRVEKVPSP